MTSILQLRPVDEQSVSPTNQSDDGGQQGGSRVAALHFELLLTLTVAVCFLKALGGGAESNAGWGGERGVKRELLRHG